MGICKRRNSALFGRLRIVGSLEGAYFGELQPIAHGADAGGKHICACASLFSANGSGMTGFKKYLIVYFIGIIIGGIGAIVLYYQIGLSGVFGVILLIFGDNLCRAYKESECPDDKN